MLLAGFNHMCGANLKLKMELLNDTLLKKKNLLRQISKTTKMSKRERKKIKSTYSLKFSAKTKQSKPNALITPDVKN